MPTRARSCRPRSVLVRASFSDNDGRPRSFVPTRPTAKIRRDKQGQVTAYDKRSLGSNSLLVVDVRVHVAGNIRRLRHGICRALLKASAPDDEGVQTGQRHKCKDERRQ